LFVNIVFLQFDSQSPSLSSIDSFRHIWANVEERIQKECENQRKKRMI
jgi:hypothetical protein